MNLLEVRKMFVKLSGRYDLVVDTTDWEDDGADYFLQSGQNMIEKLVGDLPESEGRLWKTLTSDDYYVGFQQRCRTILKVWANNSVGRVELEKVNWEELKTQYACPLAEISKGYPLYYCPAQMREIDATDKDATGTFFNYTSPTSSDYRGIVIMPPVDGAYDIEVFGKFLQPVLGSDTQENFWTITYPEILIRAAMYQNELMYRGRSAMVKLYESLLLDISEIDKDAVAETVAEIDQIKG